MQPLRSLLLSGNPITYVAGVVAEMTNLLILDLADTKLPMLPADLVDLSALTELKLDNVKIESPSLRVCQKGIQAIFAFLNRIRNARATTELALVDFDCDGGRDIGIGHYALETVLQSLDISRSMLDLVSQTLLALSSLTFLDISQNQVRYPSFPSTFCRATF